MSNLEKVVFLWCSLGIAFVVLTYVFVHMMEALKSIKDSFRWW